MSPTLLGRIQTRLVLLATVGTVWTAVLVPFLPHPLASDMAMNGTYGMAMSRTMQIISTGQRSTEAMDYHMAFVALGLMAAAGIVWEVLYHLLQQLRPSRDWPPLLVLLQVLPEAVVLWLLLRLVGVTQGSLTLSSSNTPTFVLQITTTWVLVWLAMLGPLRVLSVRWHLRGMEFVRLSDLRTWRAARTTAHQRPVVVPAGRPAAERPVVPSV